MAAGLRLEAGKVMPFMRALQEHAGRHFTKITPLPVLEIDAAAVAEELSANFVWQLKRLGPFGHGNPRPTFVTGTTELVGEPKRIGQGEKHLMFNVRWDGRVFRAIAFNQAAMQEPLMDQRQCQLAFEPVLDDYVGSGAVQLRVKAIRVAKTSG